MPIEIRELVIKAEIAQENQSGSGTAGPSPQNSGGGNGGGSEDMIKACVEKVMAILKEKNER